MPLFEIPAEVLRYKDHSSKKFHTEIEYLHRGFGLKGLGREIELNILFTKIKIILGGQKGIFIVF
jgi:hypothetical protein